MLNTTIYKNFKIIKNIFLVNLLIYILLNAAYNITFNNILYWSSLVWDYIISFSAGCFIFWFFKKSTIENGKTIVRDWSWSLIIALLFTVVMFILTVVKIYMFPELIAGIIWMIISYIWIFIGTAKIKKEEKENV